MQVNINAHFWVSSSKSEQSACIQWCKSQVTRCSVVAGWLIVPHRSCNEIQDSLLRRQIFKFHKELHVSTLKGSLL